MKPEQLTREWFSKWESGDYLQLPVSEDFCHISPFGRIDGKKNYLGLVKANEDKFLGHRFRIHEIINSEDKSVVRYTAEKGSFSMEVCEWHYIKQDLIQKIVAYYNIESEMPESRKLTDEGNFIS